MITHLYLSRLEVAQAIHDYLGTKDMVLRNPPSVAHIDKTMGAGGRDECFIQVVIDEDKS